jgi:hypothetical protein
MKCYETIIPMLCCTHGVAKVIPKKKANQQQKRALTIATWTLPGDAFLFPNNRYKVGDDP